MGKIHDEVLGADVRPVYKLRMIRVDGDWIEHILYKDDREYDSITDYIPHPYAVIVGDLVTFHRTETDAKTLGKDTIIVEVDKD
jgi:hypothetical protein